MLQFTLDLGLKPYFWPTHLYVFHGSVELLLLMSLL